MTDLRGLGERVQVGGRRGVASGTSGMLSGFIGHLPRRTVRGQRSVALQPGTSCTTGEAPSRVDGGPGTGVVSSGLLEEGKDHFGALGCEASDNSQLVHRQLEVAGLRPHPLILASPLTQ